MLGEFLEFVVSVFAMIVSLFEYTNLGGITYDKVLVAIFILTFLIRTVSVKIGGE